MSKRSDRRAPWKAVLQEELDRWSAKSANELLAELKELQVYEIKTDSGAYQVEVQMLENTASYLHISVAVDDGHLPHAMFPASQSFICQKDFQDGSGYLTP